MLSTPHMLAEKVRHLIGRFGPHPSHQTAAALVHAYVEPEPADPRRNPNPGSAVWPAARLAMAHLLWGDGYIFPGGEIETLRLARPIVAAAGTGLLLVGTGSGGPACALARNLGTWVTGLESDPNLRLASLDLIADANLDKKIKINTWDPKNPDFTPRSHHNCLALEPLLDSQPEPILDGLTQALKPGGHLILTELAAAEAFNPADPVVKRWAVVERRDPSEIQAAIAVTRMLGRIGLNVRGVEDISARHTEHAMLGWRILLRDLRKNAPTSGQAAHLVAEAERWMLRRRLLRDGQLQMVRWHATSRLGSTG
jgi:hypothetical protein